MKPRLFPAFATGALCLLVTTGAFASATSSTDEKSHAVSQLETREKELTQNTLTTSGGRRQVLELKRRHVQQLIDRLKAGESVDPQEVNKLFWNSPQ